MPLVGAAGASVRERRREAAVARPYPLGRAFGYAFRGMGKFLFGATLLSMAFIEFVLRFGWGCLPIVLAVGFWALMIGLQMALTYWPPMNELFDTAAIGPEVWLKIAAAGALTWTIVEIEKAIRRRSRGNPDGHRSSSTPSTRRRSPSGLPSRSSAGSNDAGAF